MPATKKATRAATSTLSEGELEALKETVLERKRAARGGNADGEADIFAKLAELPKADRLMGERIHAIVKAAAPELESRTWYGMPAYTKDGKVVCFFKAAAKFKTRYATFGFEETAKLDDGSMWATSWALTTLSDADEKAIGELVRRAVS
jgi:uncharacterized protein YdhG (YjbR/CyaY superfamily)